MNDKLYKAYRAAHEQGFIPIFVKDDFNSKNLVEGCVKAGLKCIEYTQRRDDAPEMIPWISKTYPELSIMVGSLIDDEKIIKFAKKKHPHLKTVKEVSEMGVDGLISMLGFSLETIKKYCEDFIIIPTSMSVTEALQQIGAGAHFSKTLALDIPFIKRCRGAAAFDYCPMLCTGGMALETIPATVDAGGIMIASGFDLILKGQNHDISSDKIAEILKTYVDTVKTARAKKWPEMLQTSNAGKQEWLDSLPHYHPFG